MRNLAGGDMTSYGPGRSTSRAGRECHKLYLESEQEVLRFEPQDTPHSFSLYSVGLMQWL